MQLQRRKSIIKFSITLVISCVSLVLISSTVLAVSKNSILIAAKIVDASVTARVSSRLMLSAYSDSKSTDVATRLGKVTLTGTADTIAFRQLASWIARSTSGVTAVDNQLIVRPPIATVL
tara:strand:+ start:273 stop:632 length:360 start_codon:yes stop_codon:yes gene_type:complete